jgi:IS5 family transposase
MNTFPIFTLADVKNYYELENYIKYTIKHINLVERRILKGETIPHEEKMFSIFETHTEWINKGKSKPSIELGKRLCVTSDQYNLILHQKIMENITDSEVVIEIADAILPNYTTDIWSFDKAFFS